jgi:tRNA threonylcarbamoyladenosine biosynthesis protein TsaB
MVRLLAVDTATAACSVALLDGPALISRCEILGRGHAERLMPMVAEVAAEAGVSLLQMQAFAVTAGPGAFTGLRIGLAAARGLALAAGRPCFAVTTLEAIAAQVSDDERAGRSLLVVLETGRGDYYAAVRRPNQPHLSAPAIVGDDDVAGVLRADGPVLVAGDGAEPVAAVLAGRGIVAAVAASARYPHAAAAARLAAARWRQGERAAAPPAPLYLRPPALKRAAVPPPDHPG